MKGSPILATALACLIMLAMYLGMRAALTSDTPPPATPAPQAIVPSEAHQVTVYAEIYFSSIPSSFSLTHPTTGISILQEENLDSPEWSGDISIPVEDLTTQEIELLCKTTWETQKDGYQFAQITLSPEDLDPQSQTLRAQGNITDVITFHWKEDQ